MPDQQDQTSAGVVAIIGNSALSLNRWLEIARTSDAGLEVWFPLENYMMFGTLTKRMLAWYYMAAGCHTRATSSEQYQGVQWCGVLQPASLSCGGQGMRWGR
jgi:hypothetical protein